MTLFHLAIPINDIAKSRRFYEQVLKCTVGRSATRWIDINFWNHQVSLHVVDDLGLAEQTNSVDSDIVPVRHFGLILDWDQWLELKHRLTEGPHSTEISWVIKPKIRFENEVGEQATMFLRDPSGNVLEFKSFQDMTQVFES